ncbi:MAG TPA: serine/threonine protein kinase, partial [Candidatus Olsenella pullicola]|nr:serine/threonine protein kinase [Candidatus Olsenella pullicola]
DAARLVAQLCEAVAALHAHGIIHRDISPTNVIVAADGAHLIDLGIARFRAEGATHDTTQLGTPGFAAPEQHGFAQTDARTDVYSLGRVLGYLLTGVRPEMPDAAEYEQALADEKIVSPQMRAVVERASAFEPSARYQSAAELARALGAEVADTAAPVVEREGAPQAVPAPEAVPAPGSGRPERRNWVKVLFAVMAAIAFVVAVAIILAQTFGQGEKDADVPAVDEPAKTQPLSEPENEADDVGDADGSGGPAAPVMDENPLEIVESGWSVGSGGYVNYAFALRNTADVLIEYPAVTVTGRDADGSVLFSDDWVVSEVAAGETGYFASMAGNGTAPATVDITPIVPDDYQYTSASEARAVFSVSGARGVSDGFGGVQFVGEVTTDEDDGSMGMGQVLLSVVLRDKSGQIIYGASGFANRPAVGKTTSFEIDAFDAPRDYTSFEIYARPW